MSKLESRDLAIFHALDNWTPRECVSTLGTFSECLDNFFESANLSLVFTVGTEVEGKRWTRTIFI